MCDTSRLLFPVENSIHSLFAPGPWPENFRFLELSFSRVFAPRNVCSLELLFSVMSMTLIYDIRLDGTPCHAYMLRVPVNSSVTARHSGGQPFRDLGVRVRVGLG